MAGPAGTKCCETFVEALGLKTLFSAFMGKVRECNLALLLLNDMKARYSLRRPKRTKIHRPLFPTIQPTFSASFRQCSLI